MKNKVKRTEGNPHDRLTRIAATMIDTMLEHREHGDERCVVMLSDPVRKESGLVLCGYEDDAEAMVDMLGHLQAIFAANGKTLEVVAIPDSPEGL